MVKKYIKPKSMTMKMRNGISDVQVLPDDVLPSVAVVVAAGKQLLAANSTPSKAAIIPKLRIFVFRKSRLLN
jgi:hypothetical protein